MFNFSSAFDVTSKSRKIKTEKLIVLEITY